MPIIKLSGLQLIACLMLYETVRFYYSCCAILIAGCRDEYNAFFVFPYLLRDFPA
jgi:hypothetical protein